MEGWWNVMIIKVESLTIKSALQCLTICVIVLGPALVSCDYKVYQAINFIESCDDYLTV